MSPLYYVIKHDGVLLANLKNLEGQRLHLPDNPMDQPDLVLFGKALQRISEKSIKLATLFSTTFLKTCMSVFEAIS